MAVTSTLAVDILVFLGAFRSGHWLILGFKLRFGLSSWLRFDMFLNFCCSGLRSGVCYSGSRLILNACCIGPGSGLRFVVVIGSCCSRSVGSSSLSSS